MSMFRRSVFALLVLTVPFQTALGATGILCVIDDLHTSRSASTTHIHDDAEAIGQHDHNPSIADHDAGMETDSYDHNGSEGKCKVRSATCCSAAALTTSPLAVFPPDSPLRVSPTIARDLVSRSGDDLFRPPRSNDQ